MAAAGPAEAPRAQNWGVVADWFYTQGWTPPPQVDGGVPATLLEEARTRMAYLEREHEDSRIYLFRVAQLITVVSISVFVAISTMILLPAEAAFFCVVVLSVTALVLCLGVIKLGLYGLREKQAEMRTAQRKYEWLTRQQLAEEVEEQEDHFDTDGRLERRLTRRTSALAGGGGSSGQPS